MTRPRLSDDPEVRFPSLCSSALALVVFGCAGAGQGPDEPEQEGAPLGLPNLPDPVKTVIITPVMGWAAHGHGGPPAKIDRANFTIENHLDAPTRIEVSRVEFVTGHDCKDFPDEVRSTPAAKGIALGDAAPQLAIELAAGAEVDAEVQIVPVEATYSHCDRYALRVYFLVDGTPRISVAETQVEREADLRGM